MGVKIHLTKRGKIGIIAIFMLLLAGSGGYLLWRVNQDDTVAPTDSDAGQSNNGSCWACCGSSSGVSCPNLTDPQKAAGWACSTGGLYCSGGNLCSCSVKCGDGVTINKKCGDSDASACTNCYHAAPEDDDPVGGVDCNVGSQCSNVCQWPAVAYCNGDGTCSCNSNSNNGCNDDSPTCTPKCTGTNSTASCTARCSGCSNLYTYTIDCEEEPEPEPVNVCDTGSWITKPSGTYAHCTAIKYTAKGTDSDGIDESSIVVKLNNVARTNVSKTTSGTSTTITETLSSSTDCLAPGSYTLAMSWKDKLGASSNNCALSTTFTVQSDSTNVCDSGAWVAKPTGSYAYCAAIAYSATATDSDGIDQASISVKLNNVSRTGFTKSNVGTTTTISETLSSATKCLAPGSYTLAMDWKDTKGAASTNCALNTSFVVQQQVLNPDWSVTKGVVEKCIDENTASPTSQLAYTITVKNTGAGEGTITKIVDSLDTKVLQTYISGISNSGVYADGDITWTLSTTDKVFAANQSKVFTYLVTVPKDTFGTYTNTVTAYPATGENIIANANVTADCVIEAPVTGIFDSVWSKVILGFVFIAIGLNYVRVLRIFSSLLTLAKKTRISVNDLSAERRKKNFEKKVVKR